MKVDPNNNKLLFENDRVRVYEVKSLPGNTRNMHSHPAHVVYFVLQGITMKSKSVITVQNDSAYRIDVDALHDGKTMKEVLVARRTGDC